MTITPVQLFLVYLSGFLTPIVLGFTVQRIIMRWMVKRYGRRYVSNTLEEIKEADLDQAESD